MGHSSTLSPKIFACAAGERTSSGSQPSLGTPGTASRISEYDAGSHPPLAISAINIAQSALTTRPNTTSHTDLQSHLMRLTPFLTRFRKLAVRLLQLIATLNDQRARNWVAAGPTDALPRDLSDKRHLLALPLPESTILVT